jgi:secreted PhoX family phosphatase
MKMKVLSLAISTIFAASAAHALDFGQEVENEARQESLELFGTLGTLGASSTTSVDAATANANPLSMITVAPGLKATVVSAAPNLGKAPDQMVLWPNDTNPTHIIECNEEVGPAGAGGLQRIRLSDGFVENIIASPLVSCDPVEITPWGTIIAGEEAGTNGRMFEILDPLSTESTDVTVSGTGATTTTDSPNVRVIAPLGQLSFEGISVMPNGVVYYQDENRPSNGNGGGGYFKFIPNTLWTGGAPITSLDNSPLLGGGRVFALRLGRNGGNTDFGQGNAAGRGVWVEVVDGTVIGTTTINRNNLRAAALALKATTGYRPEDQDIDKKAAANGNVRVCGTNTGQDTTTVKPDGTPNSNGDNNFGTTFCITDGTLADAAAGTSIPEYQTLIDHYLDFGMPDNIAYQPGRGNWIINEDGDGATYTPPRNNDIWSCLDDGADKDHIADACVKVATLNDLTAETTGGVFNAAGNEYYVSIQHNVTGHGAIVKISGWKNRR